MKFQCGKCDKYFTIKNIHVADKDMNFQCDNCDNRFFINRNFVFSSSEKNSSIVCENCGQLVPEQNKACDSCNLILNKIHEELRIDNKYYESLEISENGQVSNAHSGKILSKRNVLIPGLLIAIVILVSSAWYFTKTNNIKNSPQERITTETQVVIMKSGQTYYADQIEKDGAYIKITTKNGSTTKILEKNVLQIAKATIEE